MDIQEQKCNRSHTDLVVLVTACQAGEEVEGGGGRGTLAGPRGVVSLAAISF